MRRTFHLTEPLQAHKLLTQVLWPEVKAWLICGGGPLMIELKTRTRSNLQNALLHAIFQDIAKSVTWHGKKLDADVWKRLCMAAWLRECGDAPMLIPAIDGNGFDVVFEKTSKLTRTQCSSLIEWCFAFGEQNGAVFSRGRVEEGQEP